MELHKCDPVLARCSTCEKFKNRYRFNELNECKGCQKWRANRLKRKIEAQVSLQFGVEANRGRYIDYA